MDEKLMSLHRYFAYADQMYKSFNKELNKQIVNWIWKDKISSIKSDMYMSLWYWMLYVVIEWWQALKLKDDIINGLLESKNTDLLKRYRNGTFHYQKIYNDSRFQDFYIEKTTVEWVRNLHDKFSKWFLDKIKNSNLKL